MVFFSRSERFALYAQQRLFLWRLHGFCIHARGGEASCILLSLPFDITSIRHPSLKSISERRKASQTHHNPHLLREKKGIAYPGSLFLFSSQDRGIVTILWVQFGPVGPLVRTGQYPFPENDWRSLTRGISRGDVVANQARLVEEKDWAGVRAYRDEVMATQSGAVSPGICTAGLDQYSGWNECRWHD